MEPELKEWEGLREARTSHESTEIGWGEGAEKESPARLERTEMRQARRAGWAGSWVAVGQGGGC